MEHQGACLMAAMEKLLLRQHDILLIGGGRERDISSVSRSLTSLFLSKTLVSIDFEFVAGCFNFKMGLAYRTLKIQL